MKDHIIEGFFFLSTLFGFCWDPSIMYIAIDPQSNPIPYYVVGDTRFQILAEQAINEINEEMWDFSGGKKDFIQMIEVNSIFCNRKRFDYPCDCKNKNGRNEICYKKIPTAGRAVINIIESGLFSVSLELNAYVSDKYKWPDWYNGMGGFIKNLEGEEIRWKDFIISLIQHEILHGVGRFKHVDDPVNIMFPNIRKTQAETLILNRRQKEILDCIYGDIIREED